MKEISNDELGKLAYAKVKQMILSQKLKPGQKIVQDKLALSLGISRTPLRSALQMLQAEYLVEAIPRRGVVVREFSNQEIVEIYDCRAALECTAIQLFTESVSDAKVAKLAKFFQSYQEKPNNINEKSYQKADAKFHNYIIENCGNNFLTRLFQNGNLLVCITNIGLIRPPSETLSEHLDIIDAVQKRNKQQANDLLQNHLLKSKELILEKMQHEK